jgi:hypothetical protein
MCHYKDTADHDDVWEMVDDVNCMESGQDANNHAILEQLL